MTGRQGFHGNLTAARIINQILSIPQSDSLTNIVAFVGMGEPTDNLRCRDEGHCHPHRSRGAWAWSPGA